MSILNPEKQMQKIVDGVNTNIQATVLQLSNTNPIAVAIVDGTGAQISSFGGGTQYTDGGTPPTHPVGTMPIFNNAGAWAQVSNTVGLPVNIVSGAGSGGTASTDNSAFTAGTTSGTPAMGFFHSAIDTVTDGRVAALAIDAKRNLFTVLRDAAGNARGVNVTASNELSVIQTASIPAGTNSIGKISDITTSITPGVGATNLGKAEDAAHTSGDTGVMALAVRNDTGAVLAGTDGDYIPFTVDATGALRTDLNGTVSTNNSSTATLLAAATFTGTSEDAINYNEIRVSVIASHASATDGLSIQQSSDNTNWDITDTYTIPATTGKTYAVPRQARYFRVVYTNGGTNQTSFRLQTIFNRIATVSSSQRPNDGYTNETDLTQSQSFLMGFNGTTWDRLRTTGTGVLTTSTVLTAGAAVIGALTANQSVNAAQINGTTPLMGNGVTGTGSQRVTIASDNTAFSVNSVQGTAAALTAGWPTTNGELADTTGTFTNATQTTSVTTSNIDGYSTILISINGTYGTATAVFEASDDSGTTWYGIQATRSDTGIIEGGYTTLTNTTRAWIATVPGFDQVRIRSTAVASGTVSIRMSVSSAPSDEAASIQIGAPLPAGTQLIGAINGPVAGGATDTANPVKVGGKFNTARPTYSDGQVTDLQTDSRGNTFVVLGVPSSTGNSPTMADNTDGVAVSATANKYSFLGRNTLFNGTTWDRAYGTTNGAYVQGVVADAIAIAGNPIPIGAVYETAPPTYTAGQRSSIHTGSRGSMWVSLKAEDSLTGITAKPDNADGVAVISSSSFLGVASSNRVFNGTTWDRQYGNSGGIFVQGATASGASLTVNPITGGGLAKTTNPTAVSDGQVVNALHDKLGKQVVVGSIRDLKVNQITTITSSVSETTVLTAVASTFLDVYGCIVTNTSATAVNVAFKDSTAGTTQFNIAIPAGETRGFMLPEGGAIKQGTVNNNWTATGSGSISSLIITMLAVKNI